MKQITHGKSLSCAIGQHWPLIIFGLAHVFIFLVMFQGLLFGYAFKDNSIAEYFYGLKMYLGKMPYRDFAVEYPPLSMLFAALPILISPTYSGYLWGYMVEMLMFDLVALIVVSNLVKERRLDQWKTLGVYTLALLAVGPIITVRFDIIPAAITLLSLYALIKGRSKIAWALLALGAFTKIYPAVLAPIFLVYQLRQNQRKQLLSGLVASGITSVVILVPSLMLSPSGLWYSLTYHVQRGLQIESIYASILELLHALNIIPLSFIYNFGSTNLVSPTADLLASISSWLMLLGLCAIYWFFFRALKYPSVKP